MATSRAIPRELHNLVLDMLDRQNPDTGRPWRTREVAEWLKRERHVECSHMAIVRLAASTKKDADAFVAQTLRESFIDAMDPLLDRVERMAEDVEDAAKDDDDAMKKAVALRAVTGALDTVARLGGLVGASARVDVKGKTDGLSITFYLPAKHDDPVD